MLRISSQQKFTHINEFQIIENKKVGCGSFGTVKLARHRSTCRMYALKVIALKDMPSEAELKLVQRQIRLHSELDHPHVIKLWDTILEGDQIYMVMEYAEQGNLFSYQNTKSVFSQTQAFKFFTQTIHGLRYLHQQNIIHRDLKPENILLDALGNIKICDFGWCAEEIHAKRTTFCGTYEYMAPQMLFKSQYDYHVDIWALGVLLYEMLHGYAPFKGKTTAEVKEAMLKGSYQLASHLSQSVKDLIRVILQFHPERRLSLDNILKHPWIDEMDNFVNNYLTLENAILPKQIQKKIGDAPPPPVTPMSRNNFKRRKNNSLNFEEAGHSININLEINNYSIVGKQAKNRNNYHSQQKQREVNDFYAFKEASDKRGSLKKGKMEGLKSSQIDPRKFDQEMNGLKMLEKIKASKASKASTKELNAMQKKLNDHGSKKKAKLRKSEMEMHDRPQKHAIRFNTEANDQWCEAPKLKKAGGKSKLLASNKSAIRLHKHLKD